MNNFGQQSNDARYGAILAGGQEQSRLAGLDQQRGAFENAAQAQGFGQSMSRADFGNDARQQQFLNQQSQRGNYMNEQYAARDQPINEIAALLGTGQVSNPNFASSPQAGVANTDYAGMVGQNYNQQLAAWQSKMQNNPMNGIMGGLFGMGQAALMPSDRRLKTDVTFLGWLRDLPIYAYRYIWGGPMHVGVMAQDMLHLRPAAVVPMGDFLAVDYGRL
jgi:hypothetical protein